MDWIRQNIVLLTGVSFVGIIVFFSIVFYTRVSDMIPVVAQIRKDLDEAQQTLKQIRVDISAATDRTNELRKHLDTTLEQADIVRGKLNETDNKAAELIGRMDERIKGLEAHSPPLPFVAPGGRRP